MCACVLKCIYKHRIPVDNYSVFPECKTQMILKYIEWSFHAIEVDQVTWKLQNIIVYINICAWIYNINMQTWVYDKYVYI